MSETKYNEGYANVTFDMLSNQQKKAIEAIAKWHKKASRKESGVSQSFVLNGYAGTGKTSILKFLLAELNLPWKTVVFMTYTGKASLVLKRKLPEEASVGTIHSWIYSVTTHICPTTGKEVLHSSLKHNDDYVSQASLIILDEHSMVNESLAKDIESFGVPILAVGDPKQLPPVSGDSYYNRNDFLLTQIHRQGEDNPIIQLATKARTGKRIRPGVYRGATGMAMVCSASDLKQSTWESADQVLCSYNRTRKLLNQTLRKSLFGIDNNKVLPQKGERVICLRNNYSSQTMNGEILTVADNTDIFSDVFPEQATYHMRVLRDDLNEPQQLHCSLNSFDEDAYPTKPNRAWDSLLHRFCLSYAITVHKSQGSEWEKVLFVDEGFGRDEETKRRALYTAITRASDRLVIVRD